MAALVAVVALTGGVLVFFDGHDDNAQPVPTTGPVAVVRVPTTFQPDIVRRSPWRLQFDTSGVEVTSPQIPGATLASVLEFASDGTLHGNTGFGGGCDEFTADYSLEGGALTIDPLTGHLGCTAAGALDIRVRLSAVTAYEIAADRLVLLGDGGKQLLVYGHV